MEKTILTTTIKEDYTIQTPLSPGTKIKICECEKGILKIKDHHKES